MNHGHTIRTLNELIAVGRDGEKGYNACARLARSEHLRRILLDRARECADAVDELQALVHQLGGNIVADDSVFSTMRRRWVGVRATLAVSDDADVLDECERGDDCTLEAYRNALDDHLPDFVRAVVQRQFEDVMSNRDLIRRLRTGAGRQPDRIAAFRRQTGP